MAKVTIKDVAAKAGVSVKTVSRVINSEPNVREELQQKVNLAIKSLGYKPNPLARGLRSQQSYIVTVIYTNPNPDYIMQLITGALNQCEKHGYQMHLKPMDYRNENVLDEIESMVKHSTQDGFMVTHPLCDIPELRKIFDERNIPFVRISPFDDDHPSPIVGSNDFLASKTMTEYLIELGHDKIAYILGHPEFGATKQRFDGFKLAMNNAGLRIKDEYLIEGDFSFETAEKCTRQLLSLDKPPTAIYTSNDITAAAVLKVAAQKKIKVPSELSVAGFDNSPISNQVWPSLTTISQPVERIGEIGMEKLIKQIRKEPFDQLESRLDCTLIQRHSTSLVG